jgi:hypothetical protein
MDASSSQPETQRVKTKLFCPCGARVVGVDQDDLVKKAQEHLAEKHPELNYTPAEILAIAY